LPHIATNTKTSSTTTNFTTYENPNYMIKIQYPTDWEKIEPNNIPFITVASRSPLNSVITVVIQDLPSYTTMDSQTVAIVRSFSKTFSGFNLIDLRPVTLSGNPAEKIEFTAKIGQVDRNEMQLFTIKDPRQYVITYAAIVDQYAKELTTAQQMIDSFKIIR
jgi:serine/threonine-protein kinase